MRSIRMPVSAVASILHRISGVILFVAIGGLLWLWQLSLSSAAGFASARTVVTSPLGFFVLWGVLTALVYHLCAGIRHLLMDLGYFEEKHSGQVSARIVIAVAVVAGLAMGVWLW